MTDQDLEILLAERCKTLDLKQTAFNSLEQIFEKYANDEKFMGGFDRNEILTIFDRFEYHIERPGSSATIRTRIRLYVEDADQIWINDIEPIGYYELETDLKGEILDDWFVLEKEKYLKDIGIISHFQSMNEKLPVEYLRRNHIQYEFVAYISLVGTLFMSKKFEGAGRFVQRANTYLKTTNNAIPDNDYLRVCKRFLKMMSSYLVKNNLVTESLRQELTENKNSG